MGYCKFFGGSMPKGTSRTDNSITALRPNSENCDLSDIDHFEHRLRSDCENLEPHLVTQTPYINNISRQTRFKNRIEDTVQFELEIPSWRVKIYTPIRSTRVTEDLSDDSFDQRHSKFEVEERKRQRWDLQFTRQQTLRKNRSSSSIETEEELSTFWPDINSLDVIEFTDTLPVSAFGIQLRRLKSGPFSLPWLKFDQNSKKPLRRQLQK